MAARLALLVAALATTAASPAMLELRVDGLGDGTPHRSLHAARDAIRLLGEQQLAAGVRVSVQPGVYLPLHLTALDSGRPGAAVIWQGAGDAVISAGRDIPGSSFQPWSNRSGVWTADLRALGITKYGNLSVNDSGTGNLGCTHDHVALYFQRQAMVLARFPNVEPSGVWNYSIIDRGGAGNFSVSALDPSASRLPRWSEEPNPWLHGYWFYSWADGYVPLRSTALEGGFVHVSVGEDGQEVQCASDFRLSLSILSNIH